VLPDHEDLNEWLAVNSKFIPLLFIGKFVESGFSFLAVDFFNEISIVYGTILEFCNKEACPLMSAGPKYVSYAVGKKK